MNGEDQSTGSYGPMGICPYGEIPPGLSVSLTTAAEIMAVFRLKDLSLVYVNALGRRRIDEEGALEHIQFTLNDLIGVGHEQKFFADSLLKARVMGTWSGICELRDAWGSPFVADVVISVKTLSHDRENPYLVLNASPTIPTRSDQANLSDRELLHALMNSIPDAVYFKDSASRFLRISKSMAHKFGISNPREAIGKTDFDFFSPEHASPAFETEQRIQMSGIPIVEIEEQETWADGHVNWVSTTKLPLKDSKGKIVGTYGISRDITIAKVMEKERREMESQLQIHGKLESIGRLAAGVAHEINTPTQYLTTNLRFLQDTFKTMAEALAAQNSMLAKIASGEDCSKELKEEIGSLQTHLASLDLPYLESETPATLAQSIEGLDRISRIVRSLKEFSHPSSINRTDCDINKLIENAIVVSRHEWKYVAEISTIFDENMGLFPCIPDQIGQAVLNLVVNAAHAVGDSLKSKNREKGLITVRTEMQNDQATIEVSDDGTGIPDSIREKIFEPFFTTKPVGKGTGQGLAMVKTIIESNHKGRVELTSESGKGTTFRFILPRIKDSIESEGINIGNTLLAPP